MKSIGFTNNNEEIFEYVIENQDLQVTVLNYGATITKIIYKGVDVALGYENIEDYFDNGAAFGMTVMPNCNRIKNAEITIDDKTYQLEVNDKTNNLHSHTSNSCQKKIYEVKKVADNKLICKVQLQHLEDNFPGNRDYEIIYTIENNSLKQSFSCISDTKTIFNPTQHTYFNLDGHDQKNILNHQLKIKANFYTPTDKDLIPTGEILAVDNTAVDFKEFKAIGRDIRADYKPVIYGKGYDLNFVVDGYNGKLQEVAYLTNGKILLTVESDQPGIQIYTGNYLENQLGKGNYIYQENGGVAMETQFFPDNNHNSHFFSTILNADEKKTYNVVYRFK
ncbi:MAG: aldose epimerase family protein [Erysipelotrichaceae bacterium]|jgi:aldose 1-epimerase